MENQLQSQGNWTPLLPATSRSCDVRGTAWESLQVSKSAAGFHVFCAPTCFTCADVHMGAFLQSGSETPRNCPSYRRQEIAGRYSFIKVTWDELSGIDCTITLEDQSR